MDGHTDGQTTSWLLGLLSEPKTSVSQMALNGLKHILAIFSCEGAALEVLMSVCLSVRGQVEIFRFQKVSEVSRRFQNVPYVLECSRIFQVPEGSWRFLKFFRIREVSGKVQGRFRKSSGKVQGGSGNAQGMFREGSWKVQARFKEFSGNLLNLLSWAAYKNFAVPVF